MDETQNPTPEAAPESTETPEAPAETPEGGEAPTETPAEGGDAPAEGEEKKSW